MPPLRQLVDLGAVRDRIARNRRDMLRVGLQTAVAAALTYATMRAFGRTENLSWAVIAALFTVGLSVDASLVSGLGRIAGAFLGVGVGLLVVWGVPAPLIVGLALASALANMIATLWPSFNYTAVTAAVVALDPVPDAGDAMQRAGAIMAGSLIGAAVTLTVWPSFGRRRAAEALRSALATCEALLARVLEDVRHTDRAERDAMHARFLADLETVHGHLAETYIAPRLPSGVPLREAAAAVESLWHTIVILDRVLSDERAELGPAVIARAAPPIARVQATARPVLARLVEDLEAGDDARPPPTGALLAAIDAARRRARRLRATTAPREGPRARRLHALIFALDEIERRMLQLVRVLLPEAGDPPGSPPGTGEAR
jgi:uncharacterized membrane protein YccC